MIDELDKLMIKLKDKSDSYCNKTNDNNYNLNWSYNIIEDNKIYVCAITNGISLYGDYFTTDDLSNKKCSACHILSKIFKQIRDANKTK